MGTPSRVRSEGTARRFMHGRPVPGSLQFRQLVSGGADRGADLFLVVMGRDEESKTRRAVGHCRVQNRLDVDATVEQSA